MKRRVFSLFLPVVLFAGISLLGQEKAGFAQEKNVKPGIKEKSLDLEFKLADWLKKFEVENREVFQGKEVFRKETEEAGLIFLEELKIDGFNEDNFLRFRKD